MRAITILLFFYCALMAILFSVSGFASAKNSSQFTFQFLFLPVTYCFITSLVIKVFFKADWLTVQDISKKRIELVIAVAIFLILLVSTVIRILNK